MGVYETVEFFTSNEGKGYLCRKIVPPNQPFFFPAKGQFCTLELFQFTNIVMFGYNILIIQTLLDSFSTISIKMMFITEQVADTLSPLVFHTLYIRNNILSYWTLQRGSM